MRETPEPGARLQPTPHSVPVPASARYTPTPEGDVWHTTVQQMVVAEAITALVRDVRSTLRRANPNAKLSAAVYGIAAPDGGNIAQYWPDWLRAGTVDFLVPMNYTESPAEFANWLRTQQSYPGAKGKIIPGIGVTADESRLDPAQVVRQVVLARQAGCPGFVLFALSGTLREETLPALRQGITRPIP